MMYSSGIDPHVRSFLKKTNITDSKIKDALDGMTKSLKENGLWDKMDVIYPVVGGTSFQHSVNLKDVDNYQIVFSGVISHSYTGIVFNKGYANTKYKSLVGNFHAAIYYRTTPLSSCFTFSTSPASSSSLYFWKREAAQNRSYFQTGRRIEGALGDVNKGTTICSASAGNMFIDDNGKIIATYPGAGGGAGEIWLSLTPYVGYDDDSTSFAFYSFGKYLTESESSLLRTIINRFQYILQRT